MLTKGDKVGLAFTISLIRGQPKETGFCEMGGLGSPHGNRAQPVPGRLREKLVDTSGSLMVFRGTSP